VKASSLALLQRIDKRIILHVLLYGFETQYLINEEHRLKVSENRVLRRVFGLKRQEET
jgi:hypothetical protein